MVLKRDLLTHAELMTLRNESLEYNGRITQRRKISLGSSANYSRDDKEWWNSQLHSCGRPRHHVTSTNVTRETKKITQHRENVSHLLSSKHQTKKYP